jgi:hypothetical protein
MERDGDNPNSLSSKLRGRTKQPQIFKFLEGIAREPKRSTLAPVAEHYGIPIDALYDPRVADEVYADIQAGRRQPRATMAVAAAMPMPAVQAQIIEQPLPWALSQDALHIARTFDWLTDPVDRNVIKIDFTAMVTARLRRTPPPDGPGAPVSGGSQAPDQPSGKPDRTDPTKTRS